MARSRVDLTEGPIFSRLLTFAMPIFLGTVVNQLYNVADSMIVGHLACLFPAPNRWATTTLVPEDIPTKNSMIMLITGAPADTAASASLLTKCPTIMESANLYAMYCETLHRDGELLVSIEWFCRFLFDLNVSICNDVVYVTDHGVPSIFSNGLHTISPKTVRQMDPARVKKAMVPTALCRACLFPAPNRWATTTLVPEDIPTKN